MKGARKLARHGAVGAAIACVAALALASQASADAVPGRYIVVLNDSVDHPGAVATEHRAKFGAEPTQTYRHALKGYAARIPEPRLAALRSDPRVEFVSEDRTVEAASIPTGIDRIEADLSTTASGDGSGSVDGVNVAVIDDGIDLQHSDLNVAGGVNCSNDKKGGYDDQFGHGTHVAGTIGAKDDGVDDPSEGLEVVGVAPGVPLWAVRVFRKNGASTWGEIVCGIDFVTSTRTDGDPDNDIAVANMSLGGKGRDDGNCGLTNKDAVHQAICNSTAAGVTYVVGAMNSGVDLATSIPATYDEVLTVSAIADSDGEPGGIGAPNDCGPEDDVAADFSNFATAAADRAHTVAAPGVCIQSTWIIDAENPLGLRTISGTSMAAPHVAGTAALCISTGECTGTPQQIIQTLMADAAAYNLAHPAYGFLGDPLNPIAGKYYGYLVRTGLY